MRGINAIFPSTWDLRLETVSFIITPLHLGPPGGRG